MFVTMFLLIELLLIEDEILPLIETAKDFPQSYIYHIQISLCYFCVSKSEMDSLSEQTIAS